VKKNQGVLEDALHPVGIGDEVGGQVAAVELHPLDDVQGRFHALGFLDGDDAVLADLVHRLGDDLADGFVVVGGNGSDLGDHIAGDLAADLLQLGDDGFDGPVDALLDQGRVGPGRDVTEALAVDGLGQDGGGRGAVAGHIRRLGRHFLHQLGAHVLISVLDLDFLGHGHAVLGACGGAELLVDDDVLAPGAEGRLDQVAQGVDALEHRMPGFVAH